MRRRRAASFLSAFRSFLLALVVLGLCLSATESFAQSAFIRGDGNGDGSHDVSDVIVSLRYLFGGAAEPSCLDAIDVNDDGSADVSDPVALLAALFQGGSPPDAPYPDCGLDTTPSELNCLRYEPCATEPEIPRSAIVETLALLSFSGTEPCCLGSLGVFPARAGTCESLGGRVVTDIDECSVAPESPVRLEWEILPPVTVVDPVFPVAVVPDGDLDADEVTLDLVKLDAHGEIIAIARIAESPFAPDGLLFEVDVASLAQGAYSLVASAWRLDLPFAETHEGFGAESNAVDPARDDVRVAVTEIPEPFHVGATDALLWTPHELANVESASTTDDPEIANAVLEVEIAEEELRQFEESAVSPEEEELKNIAREIEELRRQERAAETGARFDERYICRQIERLRRELELLALVEGFIETFAAAESDFTPIKNLLLRREAILAGVAEDDDEELDEALAGKRDRLRALEEELREKRAALDQLQRERTALESQIRAQFHATRALAGQNIGSLTIRDGVVDYTISGLLVVDGGRRAIKTSPHSPEFRTARDRLDEMIDALASLQETITAIEREIETLETEKRKLEEYIARHERAEGEIAETDAVLEQYFDPVGAPHGAHLAALLAALDASGYGWLAEPFRGLFGATPHDCDEYDAFRTNARTLKARIDARERELQGEITRLEAEKRAAAARRSQAEARRRAAEARARTHEERLRRQKEAARARQEAAYRQAQERARAEAERKRAEAELARRIEALRAAAREGDEQALQQLGQLLGLNLLNEATGALQLGTIFGGFLTAAQIPACACKILRATRNLYAERDNTMISYLANEVIREFRECAGLPTISSAELGTEALADAVRRTPRDRRARIVAAIDRVMKLRGC